MEPKKRFVLVFCVFVLSATTILVMESNKDGFPSDHRVALDKGNRPTYERRTTNTTAEEANNNKGDAIAVINRTSLHSADEGDQL